MASGELLFKRDMKRATAKLSTLQKKIIPRVAVRTLNKTGTTLVKEAAKRIKQDTALPARFIKRKLVVSKSKGRRLVWTLASLRSATNIIEWVSKAKQTTTAFRKKPGVASKAWGKTKTYKGTFIGTGKNSGKFLVYKKDRSKPSGVAGVLGPNIRGAFLSNLKEYESIAKKRFRVVFKQEMNFELSKLKK